MAIKVTCEYCGRTLKARDESAGKTSKCPDCGSRIQIPELEDDIYDAEQYDDDDYGEDDYGDDGDDEYGHDMDERVPCRSCGEMIKPGAAKCRFCGKVFDKRLADDNRAGRRKVNKETIVKFRKEIHAVGGLWIFFGVLIGLLAIFMPGDIPGMEGGAMLRAVFGIISVIWLTSGIMSCLKHIWAVYMGLIFSYLSAVGNLINVNICGLIILAAVIVQSHRVIKAAGEMKAAGIPLDSKP